MPREIKWYQDEKQVIIHGMSKEVYD